MTHSTPALKAVPSNSFSFPIITHCHLRWDFVWQRPQQFLSRLSKTHRILFVEGPEVDEGDFTPFVELKDAPGFPNITVMVPHFPAARWGEGKWVDGWRRRLVDEALRGPLKGKFQNAVQWFYDPMAVESHLGQHGAIATVYDCMDELSQFKFAPPQLIERERRLLLAADVVFAGGRKMWESKRRVNSNSHFYGCGVDVEHFGKACLEETPVPADVAALKGPKLGFFGVVDERMDYDLIAKLADARSDWQICIVGPTAKVDPTTFPQRANLHWLGGRDYSQLPHYSKAFDVALMPFARNEATEYINPTKALEYMATATPIVSTAVPDVVSNFASVVEICDDHDEFVRLCECALENRDEAAIERGLAMAHDNTWDAIVAKLQDHICDALSLRAIKEQRLRIPEVAPQMAAKVA